MLGEARVARLGLIDDRLAPRVLPVTFALHEGALYSAVDEKRKQRPGRELARVRFLRARPQAALTVDRYEDDWSSLAWVQVLGAVRLLALADDPSAVEALLTKYDQYEERPLTGPLLRLEPDRFLFWRGGG